MNASSILNPLDTASSALLGTSLRTNATTTTGTTSTASSTATGSSQTSLSSLGTTFLKLLTEELQNQDPTSPMDSTQMVGQMISLNQLDQLASINQLLNNVFASTGSTSSTTGTAAQ